MCHTCHWNIRIGCIGFSFTRQWNMRIGSVYVCHTTGISKKMGFQPDVRFESFYFHWSFLILPGEVVVAGTGTAGVQELRTAELRTAELRTVELQTAELLVAEGSLGRSARLEKGIKGLLCLHKLVICGKCKRHIQCVEVAHFYTRVC